MRLIQYLSKAKDYFSDFSKININSALFGFGL